MSRHASRFLPGLVTALYLGLAAAAPARQGATPPTAPAGLPPIPWPPANPYSPAKWELGRLLYFDKRLSANGSIACASCHIPAHAFSAPLPVAVGILGRKETRNAPTALNRAYGQLEFWDGRAPSLSQQVAGPTGNDREMTLQHDPAVALQDLVARLRAVPGYVQRFKAVFGKDTWGMPEIEQAIATFERTILSGNSPYDRWKAGDQAAMSPAQLRGFQLYQKAKCDGCHKGPNFTDEKFHNLGVGMNNPNPDWGRFLITNRESDRGAFKTPTLRDVEHTAPYMHDGSQADLAAVVKHYNQGGTPNPWLDQLMLPLNLTAQQSEDLVAFMTALSGGGWQQIQPPTAFPQ